MAHLVNSAFILYIALQLYKADGGKCDNLMVER
jgi:hypothetical protein